MSNPAWAMREELGATLWLLRSAASKRLSCFEKDLNNSEIGRRRATRPSADGGKNIRKTARLLCGGRGEGDGNPVWMKSTKPVWSSCSCKVPSAWVTKLLCGRVHVCALDRGEFRGGLSPRTRLAHPAAVELECATTRGPSPGAQRRFD